MKKLILLVLVAVMMAGCNNGTKIKYTKHQVTTLDVGEIEYDSCEYILLYEGMAHKGNCRFCAERRKQELRELIKELKCK